MADPIQNIVQTIIDQIGTATTVQNITGGKDGCLIPAGGLTQPMLGLVAVPEGMQPVDLGEKLEKLATKLQPWRRTGTAHMQDLTSIIAWANRHKGDSSAMFAEVGDQPKLTVIADYLGRGAPVMDADSRDPNASHMRHRASYAFPISPEWKIWNAANGVAMTGGELGEFIEENAKDLLEPTANLLAEGPKGSAIEPWETRMLEVARQLQGRFGQYQTLLQLARNFNVNEVSNVSASLNRDTGESSIQFVNEHQEPDGQPVRIPNLFMIAIPIFENGAAYRIPVRFRYRKAGAAVKFIFSLHNADACMRDAVDEALEQATRDTALPLFRGKPEAAAA